MKGMIAWIYKNGDDCSNDGISSRCDKVVIVGPDIPEIFEPSDDMPAVKLIKRFLAGREYVHAEPVKWERDEDIKGIFGGTFIYSSDSRFPSDYPIPLHDREESYETYERLTR